MSEGAANSCKDNDPVDRGVKDDSGVEGVKDKAGSVTNVTAVSEIPQADFAGGGYAFAFLYALIKISQLPGFEYLPAMEKNKTVLQHLC